MLHPFYLVHLVSDLGRDLLHDRQVRTNNFDGIGALDTRQPSSTLVCMYCEKSKVMPMNSRKMLCNSSTNFSLVMPGGHWSKRLQKDEKLGR